MKTRTLPGLPLQAFVQVAVIAALAVAGLAQITTTGIRGIVRDHSGAMIPNATIKLTDTATGIDRTTVSSSDGEFLFPQGVTHHEPIRHSLNQLATLVAQRDLRKERDRIRIFQAGQRTPAEKMQTRSGDVQIVAIKRDRERPRFGTPGLEQRNPQAGQKPAPAANPPIPRR